MNLFEEDRNLRCTLSLIIYYVILFRTCRYIQYIHNNIRDPIKKTSSILKGSRIQTIIWYTENCFFYFLITRIVYYFISNTIFYLVFNIIMSVKWYILYYWHIPDAFPGSGSYHSSRHFRSNDSLCHGRLLLIKCLQGRWTIIVHLPSCPQII